jgi:hypothetical protein
MRGRPQRDMAGALAKKVSDQTARIASIVADLPVRVMDAFIL